MLISFMVQNLLSLFIVLRVIIYLISAFAVSQPHPHLNCPKVYSTYYPSYFGSGTGEQQDEFQEDFIDESQLLEIRPLEKSNKKHKFRKHQRRQKKQRNNQAQTQWYNSNQVLDSHLGPMFSQMNYPGPPGRAPDQSNTKLRSIQPTSRRQRTVPLIQATPQSQTTPYPNQNQSSILNVDLMGIFT
ncbi:MAG: hypothetical protein EZS28_054796, partial [Streblomastix strix]